MALYDEVVAPVAVRDEVLVASDGVPGAPILRAWLQHERLVIRPVTDVASVQALRASLDSGEAEALVLTRELGADIVLLDDRRARSFALQEGLPVSGTLGILRRGREQGLIPAVSPLLASLVAYGFRISDELASQIALEEGSSA